MTTGDLSIKAGIIHEHNSGISTTFTGIFSSVAIFATSLFVVAESVAATIRAAPARWLGVNACSISVQ